MPRINILIIGAGIAGNALAFWLAKLGYCDVTVVERFPSLRTTGLQIDLRGAGVEVLRRMGLDKAFRAAAAPELGIQFIDKSGRQRAYFPARKSGTGTQSFTSEYEIMRGDLCRLIYDGTNKEHTKYIFGTSVDSFEEKENGSVEVRFENGTTDHFDLVVGADGVGSRIRKLILGCQDGTEDPSFYPCGNSYISYFTVRRPIEEGEGYIAKCYIAPGRRIIFTRRHSPHEVQVYLMCRSDSKRLEKARRGDVKEEKKAIDEIFRGAGWQTDEFLNSMRDAADFYCEREGLVKMKFWSRGHVVLLGDAAHCPSANGFGTSAAMIGAYILAGELGRHCGRSGGGDANLEGLAAALKMYEKRFRPSMDKILKKERTDKGPISLTPFSIAVFNTVIGVAAFLRLDVLAMKFYHPAEVVKAPNYEEVLWV